MSAGRAALFGAVLATACHAPADTPKAAATAAATPVVASADAGAPAASSMPKGDRLRADVSSLTGTITGFSSRESALGTIVTLDADVLFDFDKAVLRPDATAALEHAARLISGGGTAPVAIVGYSDAKGEDAYNLALSRRRADAVAVWMRGRPEVHDHAFTVVGKGEADPVAPNAAPDGVDDPRGRASNRRVEIVIPH